VHVFALRFKQKPSERGVPSKAIGTHLAVGSGVPPPAHSLSATHGSHVPTLPIAVSVQVLFAGLHEFPPQGSSPVTVHSTHSSALVSHTVIPLICEQSGLPPQPTHVPPSHFDAVGSVQSALSMHSTQVFVPESQRGVGSAQSGLPKHSTHVSELESQTGVSPSQLPPQGMEPPAPPEPAVLPAVPPLTSPPCPSPPELEPPQVPQLELPPLEVPPLEAPAQSMSQVVPPLPLPPLPLVPPEVPELPAVPAASSQYPAQSSSYEQLVSDAAAATKPVRSENLLSIVRMLLPQKLCITTMPPPPGPSAALARTAGLLASFDSGQRR
jgi:hypothetical protein